MKRIVILCAVMALIFIAACGKSVEVPPAHEGKILGQKGYLPESISPSKFRLAPCIVYCDELVLVEKSDKNVKEHFTLFMPKNQLNMTFDIRMTAAIKDGQTDTILNNITPQPSTGYTGVEKIVTFEQVYAVYARPIIRDVVRSTLAEFTIDEIASSREAVNQHLKSNLNTALKGTPITLKQSGLANAQYPEVIVKRKEQAEERRIQIEQEEANKKVKLIKLQTDLETAKAKRAVLREQAQATAEQNEIASKSISEEYLQWKRLEVLAEIAKSGSAVFVPFEALDEVGLSQQIFK